MSRRWPCRTAETFTPGDPFDRDDPPRAPRVQDAARAGQRDTSTRATTKARRFSPVAPKSPEGLDKGYFVRPTVFSNVSAKHDHRPGGDLRTGAVDRARFDSEEDAIQIANDTVYGLAGGVWSGDKEHAEQVARRLRSGQVEVNGGGLQVLWPPSAATSSRATAASSASTAWRSTWRSRRSSAERVDTDRFDDGGADTALGTFGLSSIRAPKRTGCGLLEFINCGDGPRWPKRSKW